MKRRARRKYIKTYMKSYWSALAGKIFLDSHRTSSEEEESNTSTVSEDEPASLESESANEGEIENNVKYDEDDAHNVIEDEDLVSSSESFQSDQEENEEAPMQTTAEFLSGRLAVICLEKILVDCYN